MNRPLVIRVAPLAALIILGAAHRPLLAAGPDPWTRVPALPTGCYQNSDDFDKRLAAANEAVEKDLQRQEDINSSISEDLKNIDPMELASRQQKYMMEHPKEAMALMQRNQQLGQGATDAGLRNADNEQKLLQELEQLDTRYSAALDAARAPLAAKYKDLEERAGKDKSIQNEAGTYEGWALKEYNDLIRQENAAYERVCPQYWSAAGLYQAWLTRYKDHLVEEIPQQEEADAVGAGFIAILASTPEKSWQSTAKLTAVHHYMDQAARVFAKRAAQPRPTAQ